MPRKKLRRISCIYCVYCLDNDKRYVGETSDFNTRISGHKHSLKYHRSNANRTLQEDWDKYGKDRFEFIIIEECNQDELIEKEKFWIKYYRTKEKEFGYNLTEGGKGSVGWVMPESTKEKIYYKSKTHKFTQSQKDKMSSSNIGLKKKAAKNRYAGVCFLQYEQYWSVKVNTGRKRTYIGCSCYEVEAAMMYNEIMLEYYGWKANDKLNVITQEEIDILWETE